MKISENFTLEELVKSDTAKRLGIENMPTPEQFQLSTRPLEEAKHHSTARLMGRQQT
jgi:hypothetical protein